MTHETRQAVRLQAAMYTLLQQTHLVEHLNTVDHQITVAQSYALLACAPDAPISMSALSDALHLAPSTATRTVDGLVKRGLVARERGEADRRQVSVVLTDAGRARRAEIEADYDRFFAMLLEEIPPDQRAETLAALETIVAGVARVIARKHTLTEE